MRSIITARCLRVAILKGNGAHHSFSIKVIGLYIEAREMWARLSLDLRGNGGKVSISQIILESIKLGNRGCRFQGL
jgi:hypothetical protein